MSNDKTFESLIGQDSVKRHLKFMLNGFDATGRIPNLLFVGSHGNGKTEFAKRFCAKLKRENGSVRPFVEINCGCMKRGRDFFEIVYPHKIADREVSVLFDECHALPRDLVVPFLTLFAVNTSKKASVDTEEGGNVEFDFTKQSFIFATTESDKIFKPLKNRLEEILFDYYSDKDIEEMFSLYLNIQITDEALEYAARTVRHIARNVVKLCDKINMYCSFSGKAVFSLSDWHVLSRQIGIMPWGLTNIEYKILDLLQQRGEQSVQAVSACTGLSRSALMGDVEHGLFRMGFIDKGQNSKRLITSRGVGALNEARKIRASW